VKHAPLKRRLLAGAAATAIGVIGAVALASPASAHHTGVSGEAVCDEVTGEWVISWTVTNSETDIPGTFTSVVVTPEADLTPVAVGGELPIGGITVEQRVSAETTSASLEVSVEWDRKRVRRDTKKGEVTFGGECAPPPSPSPSPEPEEKGVAEAEFDCEVFSLVLNNNFSEDVTLSVVPSVGEAVDVTVPAGESSEPIEFPASAGLTVDVQDEEGASVLEEGAFEIDADEFTANCEDDGQGGDLPVTGASTGLIAGGAVALLVLGAGLFLVARRRRIRFTA
jgi:LPXTG-motif cell wall-anchored protein